ncbi:uncharacterized protein PV07_11560 [Cladophialophora immunda]|uniref:Zn(2)-C6 fungal-type domain-containing protein n=1 Tax=Cladophialophora immunda TaxID=569365 RepID=A0A0D2BWA2_9EURO|nr:uncharacterized protein PV07_11560 [Cladophialophora immunda]KIW23353.1 hypothetical protein PV07_11560 [Cladophialophora immunda]
MISHPKSSSPTSMSLSSRPLRPATLPSEHSPLSQPSPDLTPAASFVQESKRRTKISSACQSCRKARRKCDGCQPCKHCLGSNQECLYRTTDHRTRKYRQNLEAERDKSKTELERLLHAIRTSSEWEAVEILRSLRSGSDVSTALKCSEGVVAQPAAISRQHMEKVYDLPQSKDPSSVLSLYGILQPFDQATTVFSFSGRNSVQWTTVTQNPEIISYLLNLYFTYHHPICPVIPEPLIRADMTSGRMKYCSPVLINAVLAVACTFLGLQDDVKSSNDPWPSAKAFSIEAERLLSEQPEPSLTAVAALSLLTMVEILNLRFQLACKLSARASCMALFLGLHMGRLSEKEQVMAGANEWTLAAVQQQLFWVCFQVDQMASNNAGCLPQIVVDDIEIKLPSIDTVSATGPRNPLTTLAPFLNCGDRSGSWVYLADLAKIVQMTLLQPRPSFHHKDIDIGHWESRYQAWYSNLPASLAVSDTASAYVISIHMWYHGCMIQSFRQIVVLGRASLRDTALQICRHSAKTITDLFSRYRSLHGLRGINAIMCQAMLDAYRTHLDCFVSAVKDLLIVVEAFQDLCKRQQWARAWLARLESQTVRSPIAKSAAIVEALFGKHETISDVVAVPECSSSVTLAVSHKPAATNMDNNMSDARPDVDKPASVRPHRWKDDYFFSPFT